jgi:hypothetical protein
LVTAEEIHKNRVVHLLHRHTLLFKLLLLGLSDGSTHVFLRCGLEGAHERGPAGGFGVLMVSIFLNYELHQFREVLHFALHAFGISLLSIRGLF